MRTVAVIVFVVAVAAGGLVPGTARAQGATEEPRLELTLLPWWVQVEGFLEAVEETPVGRPRIDVVETLGLAGTEVQGRAGLRVRLGRHHRILVGASRARHAADTELREVISFQGTEFPLRADVSSAVELEEAHLLYELVLTPAAGVELGLLVGGGGLRLTGAIAEPRLGRAASTVTAPAPLAGAELRLDSGRLAAEVRATGFPRVEIQDLEAFLLDVQAIGAVRLTDNVALVGGYRRYELDFEQAAVVEFGLVWQGVVGGVRLSL